MRRCQKRKGAYIRKISGHSNARSSIFPLLNNRIPFPGYSSLPSSHPLQGSHLSYKPLPPIDRRDTIGLALRRVSASRPLSSATNFLYAAARILSNFVAVKSKWHALKAMGIQIGPATRQFWLWISTSNAMERYHPAVTEEYANSHTCYEACHTTVPPSATKHFETQME